jgi:predicted oxidoreductase
VINHGVLEAKESMRVTLYVWASARTGKQFTIGEAMQAFNKAKGEISSAVYAMESRNMVRRLNEVRNGFTVFEVI